MTIATLAPTLDREQEIARRARSAGARTRGTASRAALLVARLVPLGAILALQGSLSYRLVHLNTAFEDEATYLGAGHQLIQAWLHGGPNMAYPTYFSGAPVIYPVIGALIDSVGKLAGARLFSMAMMLIATALAYASARRLISTVAGWLAAATFAVLYGTQFLGALATYDAMALCVTALSAWIVVRGGTVEARVPTWIYLAAPVLVLANATKYASAIFDPVVVGVALFVVAGQHDWRTGCKVAAILTGISVALLSALLALAGPSYWHGITSTTTNRAASTASIATVLHDTASWIGVVVAIGALGAGVLIWLAIRHRVSWPSALLALVLFGATLLVPVEQARIHTTTSLNKHVTYGAWFGVILAGYVLAWILGRGWKILWRLPLVIPLLVPMAVVGMHQARSTFLSWFNTKQLVAAIRPLVLRSTQPVLVDTSVIPAYYLGDKVRATRWISTYYFQFRPYPGAKLLSGIPAYTAAIRESVFSVVALDWSTPFADSAIASAIGHNPRYHYLGKFVSRHTLLHSAYVVWYRAGR